MDLNTVDWSRVCGHVQYSGGIQVCVLAAHPVTEEHHHVAVERLPDELTPCQATAWFNGVLYLCALYGRHMNREHEWVRPSELRPKQIPRNRPPATTGPEPAPVRHPTPGNPLCLHPNPNGDGTKCGLPPDHGLTGHDHYYVRLGGPGPGADPVGPPNGEPGEPPESGGIGRPPTRPDSEYDPTRDRDAPRTPTTGGTGMSSVAEVKGAVDAALQRVTEAQGAAFNAREKLAEAQASMAAALEGSGHDAVSSASAALTQASAELDDFMAATQHAIEISQAYIAAL